MKGLKVPKNKANQVRLNLLEKKLLDLNFKIQSSDDAVFLPLTQIPESDFINELGPDNINIVDMGFEKVIKAPRSIEAILEDIIPTEKLEDLKKSFDIIGDVVILEIPPELESEKVIIGEAALKFTKRRSVYRKMSEVQGVTRTRKLELLAGVDNSVTIHKEFGCKLMLDVKKVYFSPRLATERKNVADQVQDGELILDMFCGVGPYVMNIALLKNVEIYATDINPYAIQFLNENIKLNKLKGLVIPYLGDVKDFLRGTEQIFDRVIMNLPETSKSFLPLAIQHLKEGGVLNYYEFNHDVSAVPNSIINAAGSRETEILDIRKVKSRSPGVWHVGVDAKIY
jgi:tRNA (guanine37-N1)-methyltransferase